MDLDLKSALILLGEKVTTWYELAIKSIPNILAALVVIILFLLLAKSFRKVTRRIFPKMTRNKAVSNLLTSITYFCIILLGLFISLEILNLEKTVTSLLAGAGVIGLALGFAFQESASNFVSGILIAYREPYQLGDIVEIEDFFGEVTNINLRTTSITTFQGLEVIIPNKDMFTKPFINFTTTPKRRLDLTVGVSYADDLEKVTKITQEALQNITGRIKEHEIEVFFKEFGSSSINFDVRMWVKYPRNQAYLKARHESVIAIKKAFDENGITIPFPIRTLDFGIKGGEKLNKMVNFGKSSQSESE